MKNNFKNKWKRGNFLSGPKAIFSHKAVKSYNNPKMTTHIRVSTQVKERIEKFKPNKRHSINETLRYILDKFEDQGTNEPRLHNDTTIPNPPQREAYDYVSQEPYMNVGTKTLSVGDGFGLQCANCKHSILQKKKKEKEEEPNRQMNSGTNTERKNNIFNEKDISNLTDVWSNPTSIL
eukprot:gb/GECH01007539.1/.p1 GENE.gb/GECH01007539.1/~~gb/GECH01007539.1/.p1  ORF type:complete len:178 (+),score=12.51 gb/GECH01007539.1/:1-534(+)